MAHFQTFLTKLAEVLHFTALAPDKQGACLVIMKRSNTPLLFEFDEKLVPNTILLSTPISPLFPSYEAQTLTLALQGNSEMEETLSLKPDEEMLYLHRRIHPQIETAELEQLIETFVQQKERWKSAFETLVQEKRPDLPKEPPSLRPSRYKV